MKGTKPATGASTQHAPNKQNERAHGASNVRLKKSMVNKETPHIDGPKGGIKGVPMAPKINAEAASPDGGKRVINGEAKPNKHTSTFSAPRSSGGGGGVTDMGYTKLGKV